MRPMSGEVLPTSRSMEDNIRSGFDEGEERYMAFRHSMQSLLWRVAFELACMYGIFVPYMFFWKVMNAIF
jgi:hypothetical protein